MLHTTTVTIEAAAGRGDPYEAETPATLCSGLRAHIGEPSGDDRNVGGAQEVIEAVIHAPPSAPLQRAAIVVDETTGDRWRVQWHQVRRGLGLDHAKAGLVRVAGAADG